MSTVDRESGKCAFNKLHRHSIDNGMFNWQPPQKQRKHSLQVPETTNGQQVSVRRRKHAAAETRYTQYSHNSADKNNNKRKGKIDISNIYIPVSSQDETRTCYQLYSSKPGVNAKPNGTRSILLPNGNGSRLATPRSPKKVNFEDQTKVQIIAESIPRSEQRPVRQRSHSLPHVDFSNAKTQQPLNRSYSDIPKPSQSRLFTKRHSLDTGIMSLLPTISKNKLLHPKSRSTEKESEESELPMDTVLSPSPIPSLSTSCSSEFRAIIEEIYQIH